MVWLLIVAVVLSGVAGDILMNQWAKTQLFLWWALSVPVWVLTATVFGLVLREQYYSFGVVVVIILLFHSGLVLAWDTFVENVTLAPMQWVGVVAAVIAITLIEVGRR